MTLEFLEAFNFGREINWTRASFFWDKARPILLLQETWKSLRILTRSFNFLFSSSLASSSISLLRRNLWQDLFFLRASTNMCPNFGKLVCLDSKGRKLLAPSLELWFSGTLLPKDSKFRVELLASSESTCCLPESRTFSFFCRLLSTPLFGVSALQHWEQVISSIGKEFLSSSFMLNY